MLAPRLVLALALGTAVAPALPAAAAPAAPGCAQLTGSAGADLIRVPAVGLRIAASHVEMSTVPARSNATARGVDAPAPAGPAAAAIQQTPSAPPGSSGRVGAPAVDLGVARMGTADLRATASDRCDGSGVPSVSASAALADATVLPGVSGRTVLRAPHNVESSADVRLSARNGRLLTTATAHAGLGDLHLLDGPDGGVRVRVVSEPTLAVTAGGTPSVHYTAPVFDITGPQGNARRLDQAGEQMDIPVGPAGTVVRLSIGAAAQHTGGGAVSAQAATLRIQVISGGAVLADVACGVLQASASAPVLPPAPVPAAAAGSLPVTGLDAGWLLGIGLLVVIGGRLLVVLARRRTR